MKALRAISLKDMAVSLSSITRPLVERPEPPLNFKAIARKRLGRKDWTEFDEERGAMRGGPVKLDDMAAVHAAIAREEGGPVAVTGLAAIGPQGWILPDGSAFNVISHADTAAVMGLPSQFGSGYTAFQRAEWVRVSVTRATDGRTFSNYDVGTLTPKARELIGKALNARVDAGDGGKNDRITITETLSRLAGGGDRETRFSMQDFADNNFDFNRTYHQFEGKDWSGFDAARGAGTTRERVPIADISINRRAHERSLQDLQDGRGSRIKGPVKLFHNTDNGQLLVDDGSHRIAEALQAGKTHIDAVIKHAGYSDTVPNVRPEDRLVLKKDWSEFDAARGKINPKDDPDPAAFADRKGRCYELAGRYATHHPDSVLVHGTIQGMGNPPLDHAWVEVPKGVYEPITNEVYSAKVFADHFHPVEQARYDNLQVLLTTARAGTWGPWHGGKDWSNFDAERTTSGSTGSSAAKIVAAGGEPIPLKDILSGWILPDGTAYELASSVGTGAAGDTHGQFALRLGVGHDLHEELYQPLERQGWCRVRNFGDIQAFEVDKMTPRMHDLIATRIEAAATGGVADMENSVYVRSTGQAWRFTGYDFMDNGFKLPLNRAHADNGDKDWTGYDAARATGFARLHEMAAIFHTDSVGTTAVDPSREWALQQLPKLDGGLNEAGVNEIYDAVHGAGREGIGLIVAKGGQGELTGAMNYEVRKGVDGTNSLNVEHLGTDGYNPGAGHALMLAAAKLAAEKGIRIDLLPSADERVHDFYSRMGMHGENNMNWTAEEVAAIAKGGKDWSEFDAARLHGRGDGGFPAVLSPLMAEARKYATFAEFEHAFSIDIKHGLYFHWTNDPSFKIDPNKGPRDMSTISDGAVGKGSLMFTSDLAAWSQYGPGGKGRAYAAVLDMSKVPPDAYHQISRGFGNEFNVGPEHSSNVKVVSVLSRAQAFRLDRKFDAALPQSSGELAALWHAANKTQKDWSEFDAARSAAEGSNPYGLGREAMPQLRGIPVPGSPASRLKAEHDGKVSLVQGFVEHLRAMGIKVEDGHTRAEHLRASQTEIDPARVLHFVNKLQSGAKVEPMLISKDHYIADGHHHWAARVALNMIGKDHKIATLKVDLPIDRLLAEANKYAASQGIGHRAIGKDWAPFDAARPRAHEITAGPAVRLKPGDETHIHELTQANHPDEHLALVHTHPGGNHEHANVGNEIGGHPERVVPWGGKLAPEGDDIDATLEALAFKDWTEFDASRKPPPFIDKCKVCGATVRQVGDHWRHMSTQPDGSPHDHNAMPVSHPRYQPPQKDWTEFDAAREHHGLTDAAIADEGKDWTEFDAARLAGNRMRLVTQEQMAKTNAADKGNAIIVSRVGKLTPRELAAYHAHRAAGDNYRTAMRLVKTGQREIVPRGGVKPPVVAAPPKPEGPRVWSGPSKDMTEVAQRAKDTIERLTGLKALITSVTIDKTMGGWSGLYNWDGHIQMNADYHSNAVAVFTGQALPGQPGSLLFNLRGANEVGVLCHEAMHGIQNGPNGTGRQTAMGLSRWQTDDVGPGRFSFRESGRAAFEGLAEYAQSLFVDDFAKGMGVDIGDRASGAYRRTGSYPGETNATRTVIEELSRITGRPVKNLAIEALRSGRGGYIMATYAHLALTGRPPSATDEKHLTVRLAAAFAGAAQTRSSVVSATAGIVTAASTAPRRTASGRLQRARAPRA